jgi:uncharacterized protein
MTEPLPAQPRSSRRDDLAYLAPMFTFLAFIQISAWWPGTYALMYVFKTFVVGALLIYFWRQYTPIRWTHLWLGVLVGVAGIFQWVIMQKFLERHGIFTLMGHHFSFFQPPPEAFDPTKEFASPLLLWSFVSIRILGAVVVVPFMEELFWRDYLWRTILAPNDFKLAAVGEWAWAPFIVVCAAFATVHGNWWLTAIGWAAMVGALLVYTKSLGACIVAHATTNLLLAFYVLRFHEWSFW